jgi:hypothetical protein
VAVVILQTQIADLADEMQKKYEYVDAQQNELMLCAMESRYFSLAVESSFRVEFEFESSDGGAAWGVGRGSSCLSSRRIAAMEYGYGRVGRFLVFGKYRGKRSTGLS